ncbi:MAG TPA: hypothetical protein VL261_06835 [Nitrospira sp.]|jgi:hypothetical protein|nr:hypothetical protein [Nitrospira sp.]
MPPSAATQLDIAAALVRLYVFLNQYLDRCVTDAVRRSSPDGNLETHLENTRRELMEILSVNPVVKRKLTDECDRILKLGASCLSSSSASGEHRDRINAEREVLKQKTIALSDLVAVFRALD